MTGLNSKTIRGVEYFYYPDDVYIAEVTGCETVYAQDIDGNEFTLIWTESGIKVEAQ